MNLGGTIRSLRKEKDLTQDAPSEKVSISVTFLSQIENNHKLPSFPILKEIAKALDLPLPILMFLAFDEQDYQGSKAELQKAAMPALKALWKTFFAT